MGRDPGNNVLPEVAPSFAGWQSTLPAHTELSNKIFAIELWLEWGSVELTEIQQNVLVWHCCLKKA